MVKKLQNSRKISQLLIRWRRTCLALTNLDIELTKGNKKCDVLCYSHANKLIFLLMTKFMFGLRIIYVTYNMFNMFPFLQLNKDIILLFEF